MKIAIIDDEESVRNLVKTIAGRIGYETIYEATDGQEGLNILISKRPDTVYTDVDMPRMKGPEMLLEAEKEGYIPKRVVVSSGGGMSEAQENLRGYGQRITFVPKPFSIDQIINELKPG